MNDDELRAAAEEVARALGMGYELPRYQCGRCGCKWLTNTTPRCVQCGEEERVSHIGMAFMADDLLTGAGALRLWDMLTEKYGVHSNTIRWAATEEEEAFVVVQVSLHPKCVLKTATTWPAALVQAAHAALQAGWLEGEGSDAE